MSEGYFLVALILLATMVIGLSRVFAGQGRVVRMLAAQLLGTNAVAVILLLAGATARPGLLDVALVFALLAAVAAVAFVRRHGIPPPGEKP